MSSNIARIFYLGLKAIQSTFSDNKGVLLQTANDDVTAFLAASLRDNNTTTCITIPLSTSPQRYLKARMSWPIVWNTNPNYNVNVIGTNLLCDYSHTLVYMKVGVTWGGPSFKGDMIMCTYASQSESASLTTCTFACAPAPNYSEGVFVFIRGMTTVGTLCEVQYEEL